LGLGLLSPAAGAEKVYGSVDEKGNITLSDTVPAEAVEVERIEVAPAPKSDAEVEASQRRAEEMVKAAEESQQQRDAAKAERKATLEEAQQRVKAAEANLSEAKEVREGDRQGMAGGGSRLTPEYHMRVQAAEVELKTAQEALKAAKSGR
jgi:hypothetical protein